MFRELRNQFKLSFKLKIDSPLCIRSGEESIDPTLPNMQCMRTYKNRENIVFIPGSSIKGVIRTRCEKIFNILSNTSKVCDITDEKNECNKKDDSTKSAQKVYQEICPACKMFGCMSLGGRFKFKDSYPIGSNFKIGYRNGVGINRITGGAQGGALYDFEVVEDGTFQVNITGENYELYQLKVLLWAIQDIDDGYVTFGSSSTRGNGKMLVLDVSLNACDFRKEKPQYICGYNNKDWSKSIEFYNKAYYYEAKIEGMENINEYFKNVDVVSQL